MLCSAPLSAADCDFVWLGNRPGLFLIQGNLSIANASVEPPLPRNLGDGMIMHRCMTRSGTSSIFDACPTPAPRLKQSA